MSRMSEHLIREADADAMDNAFEVRELRAEVARLEGLLDVAEAKLGIARSAIGEMLDALDSPATGRELIAKVYAARARLRAELPRLENPRR